MDKIEKLSDELISIMVERANKISKLNDCLLTVYLNHVKDNTIHGSSLRFEIEALAEKCGGDLKLDIDLYKGGI